MAKASSKPTMMRFEPKSGWSEAEASPTAEVVSITDHPRMEARIEPRVEPIDDENYSAEALVALGESIQDVFDSLQINDPRLQAWTQVHAAIKLIGTKLQEKKALEARQPMGRLVSADEVARALCFLASPLQGAITATSLEVDGGMQGLRIPK